MAELRRRRAIWTSCFHLQRSDFAGRCCPCTVGQERVLQTRLRRVRSVSALSRLFRCAEKSMSSLSSSWDAEVFPHEATHLPCCKTEWVSATRLCTVLTKTLSKKPEQTATTTQHLAWTSATLGDRVAFRHETVHTPFQQAHEEGKPNSTSTRRGDVW